MRDIFAAILLTLIIVSLSACETSPAWYATHPEKKTVKVDKWTIDVVPRGPNHFDSFLGMGFVNVDDSIRLKQSQRRAIEIVSGCIVKDAEYLHGTLVLQAAVKCKDK